MNIAPPAAAGHAKIHFSAIPATCCYLKAVTLLLSVLERLTSQQSTDYFIFTQQSYQKLICHLDMSATSEVLVYVLQSKP